MAEIKAIETIYNGYRFRSRLEARWAVFFDNAGIEYKYEVEGFKNDDGICYLPDFYLPKTETWVEVKGDSRALCNECDKYTELLDWGGVLPGFLDSLETSRGLLLLGDIPYSLCRVMNCHPIIQHRKGLHKSWANFCPNYGPRTISDSAADMAFVTTDVDIYTSENIQNDADEWVVETRSIPVKRYWPKIDEAYLLARQARFEYGEKG